jgi:hypothetical protein
MAPSPTTPPTIAVRVVTTYDDATRRVDLQITGTRGVVVESGRHTPFDTERLWPTVRELLPPLDQLRADPAGRLTPVESRRPGPGWVEECRAMVAIATVAGPDGLETESPQVALRTWFATDDELWSATPRPDGSTDVRLATPGDVAELLVWDVTGALDVLVRALSETP